MAFRTKPSLHSLSIYCCVLFLFSISCTSLPNNSINEGKITYSIDYPEINTEDFLINLLPDKMVMYFSEDGFRSDIEAGAGMFKTSLILNKETNQLTHSLKLLNKKIVCDLKEDNTSEINSQHKKISFKPTKNTKEIAGFLCKEVIASFPSADTSITFKIYYTEEINIEDPNRLTAFESIKGVLMEYETINYDVHMKFTAEKVVHTAIDKSKLVVEPDYKKTSPEMLYSEIQELFKMIQ